MPNQLATEDKCVLTARVLQVLRNWGLEPMVQCELLGLSPADAGRLYRRLKMGASLPEEAEIWLRVALLLRLDNALHQIFPHSAYSANLWVTSPNPRCSQQTPLAVMLTGGLDAMRRIEMAVDNLDPLTIASQLEVK